MHTRTETVSLLDTLIPRSGHWQNALMVAGGSLLLAASAQVSIPLPFSPVPVTGQTFAVLLIGATFGANRAAATVLLYLLQGALGLPVFEPTGLPGLARFAGPSAGFLLSFPVAAYAMGWLTNKWPRRMGHWLLAGTISTSIFFVFGASWLKILLGLDWSQAATVGILPFLPGAVFKLALLTLVLPASWWAADRASERSRV